MALTRGTIEATIDVMLVTLITVPAEGDDPVEIAFETGNQVGVTAITQTQDNIPLINQSTGVLLAQKRGKTIITGHTITINDNVFTPEVAQILQGGTITRDASGKIIHYSPPPSGEVFNPPFFELAIYTACYNEAGIITKYEKTTYPNCQGSPLTLNDQDNTWRVPEYVINSAPENGEAAYTMDWVQALPAVSDYVHVPTP